MWQSVQIKRNFSVFDYNSQMKIQLIPKLNKNSTNPLWAIANVRQCPQNGALRKSIMISNQDWNSHIGYFWPIETCQKLFYDEHIVVNHLLNMKPDVNLDDANCSQAKIGPQCLFSCESELNSNSNCVETICYEDGCTGVSGNNCLKFCNTYPYGCKKTNGTCDWQIAETNNKLNMLEKSVRYKIEFPQLPLWKDYEEKLISIEKATHQEIEIPQLQPSKYNTEIKSRMFAKAILYLIVILIKAGAAFYWYRRKKQRSKKLTDEIMRDETNYT
ncbi:PREDICTED: uncharacterized protein LOC105457732 [Wasmannia auropunctata]|uniref:uncharacterized protein LOC105457732 n=1 Tax=Wasmannia auropunctata TaxID=64793 RepID=UPI0005ED5F73|nr:PREDICTED: uncharacterized protein LOC105457732 [Wasmannia auropunctata]